MSEQASLPTPTGPYRVSRVAHHWIDPSRDEVSASSPVGKRGLMVWIWYPAAPEPEAQPAPYLPAGWDAFYGSDQTGLRGQRQS